MRATLLSLLVLSGCYASRFHSADTLEGALSEDSVVLPVAPVATDARGQCGLACLVSLLRFHGLDLDDAARERFSLEAGREGSIRAGDIRTYLRGRGFQAHLVHGTLDAEEPCGILYILTRRLPTIVALHVEGRNHYALVCGFDRERRWILLLDPARGIGAVPFESFDGYWEGTGRLMLVARPATPRN